MSNTGNCRGTKRKSYDLESVDLNKPIRREDVTDQVNLCNLIKQSTFNTILIISEVLHYHW